MTYNKINYLCKRQLLFLLSFTTLFFYNYQQLFSSEKHFIWEIQSEKAKVYLLGSIHVAKDDIYPLDSVIENAFNVSDYLVVEVDLKNLEEGKYKELMYYNDGTTLEDHLSKETYGKLKKVFKDYGIHPMFYKKMKPWSALSLLLNSELQSYGYKSNMGIDAYFLKKSSMKAILELESFEHQINIFDVELKDLMDEFIEYSLKDIDNSAKMIDSMFALWSIGDADGLKALILDEVTSDVNNSKLMDILFTKRNIAMANKIEEFLDMEGTFFVIAGAGHLIGDTGIIKLLENKKYKIRQL